MSVVGLLGFLMVGVITMSVNPSRSGAVRDAAGLDEPMVTTLELAAPESTDLPPTPPRASTTAGLDASGLDASGLDASDLGISELDASGSEAARDDRPSDDPSGSADFPEAAPWLPSTGSGQFLQTTEPLDFEVQFGNSRPRLTFDISVEVDTLLDADVVAAEVDAILADQRSWIGDDKVAMRRVQSEASVSLVVATPDTVDRLCHPLGTRGTLSCSSDRWIALNLHRWMWATAEWPGTLASYRRYLVNHEIGHQVGGDHQDCPGPGELAPIMMQQTKGLHGCIHNGWVYPTGQGVPTGLP